MQESGQTSPDGGSQGNGSKCEDFATYLGIDTQYESDRTVAIISVSFLEAFVQESIYCVFDIEDKHAKRLIGDEEAAGELGFSDQCRLAYCLKICGPTTLSDLLILAKVRNRFAHKGDMLSFSVGKIRDLCASLKSPRTLKEVPDWFAYGESPRPNIAEKLLGKFDMTVPKNRFLFCCWTFLSGLNFESQRLIDEPNTPPRWLH
jgi:hypothetical protein